MKDKTLKVKPIPVPLGYIHPPPPNDILPRHEFSMGLIAPKGSGKTTVICNMLKFYKGYFHSIIVFSPTVASDEKWDFVKKQNLLTDNVKLKEWVKKMREKEKKERMKKLPIVEKLDVDLDEFADIDVEPLDDFTIPEDCFYSDYCQETLEGIMNEQMKLVKLLKKYDKSKHLANRILFIFDDLVGSLLFSNARGNCFKKLNTNHRHYSASLLMVTQA